MPITAIARPLERLARATAGVLNHYADILSAASLGPFSADGDRALPKVLVNSIPKSGTHLVGRCVELMGLHSLEIHLNNQLCVERRAKGNLAGWKPLEGIANFVDPHVYPCPISVSLRRVRDGQYALSHLAHSERLALLVRRLGFKQVFIYRDPRDVAVSYYRHQAHRPDLAPTMRYYYLLQSLDSDHERLLTIIGGVAQSNEDAGGPYLPPIDQLLRPHLGWLHDPHTLSLRFEDLVGEAGGGSGAKQRECVLAVVRHLGLGAPLESNVDDLAEQLFGRNSLTFDRGRIGAWREAFDDEHKAAFKRVAGDLLVSLGYESDHGW